MEKEEREERPRPEKAAVDLTSVEDTLENAEVFCMELERHAERVASFFNAGGKGARCLSELRPGAESILSRIEQLAGIDSASSAS